MTATVNDALKAVFAKIGWFVDDEDFPAMVARARQTLADPEAHASRKEVAALIVAAADGGPAPSQSSAFSASPGQSETVLGQGADGKPLTVEGCRVAGADPLAFLVAAGVTLNAEGRKMLESLQAAARSDPLQHAKLLGIDVAALKAACVESATSSHPYDFDVALAAEIENQEILAHDLERRGPVIGRRS